MLYGTIVSFTIQLQQKEWALRNAYCFLMSTLSNISINGHFKYHFGLVRHFIGRPKRFYYCLALIALCKEDASVPKLSYKLNDKFAEFKRFHICLLHFFFFVFFTGDQGLRIDNQHFIVGKFIKFIYNTIYLRQICRNVNLTVIFFNIYDFIYNANYC